MLMRAESAWFSRRVRCDLTCNAPVGQVFEHDEAAVGLREDLEQAFQDLGQHFFGLERAGQVLADFHDGPQLGLGTHDDAGTAILDVQRRDDRRTAGAELVELRTGARGTGHRDPAGVGNGLELVLPRWQGPRLGRRVRRRNWDGEPLRVFGQALIEAQHDFANADLVAVGHFGAPLNLLAVQQRPVAASAGLPGSTFRGFPEFAHGCG